MAKAPVRKLFESYVKKNVKADKVAVLLSSGLDGLVSALAAHDLGKKVHAFTFQMGDDESFDSKHAKIVCQKMGWKFTLVKVPTDVKEIAKQWKYMHKHLHCIKKRDYECTYPMIYCYAAIKKAGYNYVLSGLVADAYFCFTRRANIERKAGPNSKLEDYDNYRATYWAPWFKSGLKSLGPDYNPSAMWQHEMLSEMNGLTHVNPWMQKKVYDLFIGRTWLELNKPKQKMPIREAWWDYIEKLGHRPHRSYQSEAKVPQYFEQLFDHGRINFKMRKRIMDIARDWESVARA